MPGLLPRNRLTRSIRGLFSPPKRNRFIDKNPDLYFKHVYIGRKQYEAITFLAKANGTNIKKMVAELLNLGMSNYIGNKISENNRRIAEQREEGVPQRATHFVNMYRHWAHQQGKDVGKFI